MKKKNVFSWLYGFAQEKKLLYVLSVIFSIIGVFFSLVPFYFVSEMVTNLIKGNKDMNYYLIRCGIVAGVWLLRVIFHSISTTLSHKATFTVLGNIRKAICDKLSRVPLGDVKKTPSGSLKNIIVERVDTIETTLAHIVPEFTANLLAPIAIFVILLVLDYRLALLAMLVFPLGILFYMFMLIGYEKKLKNAVDKTKKLNDTAVEYINGIEVIKAFGKADSSYDKFVVAAKEGADCYVEWMRGCNIFFAIAMAILPTTALFIVPFGLHFVGNGTMDIPTFVMFVIMGVGLMVPLITVGNYSDDLTKVRTITGEIRTILDMNDLNRPAKDKELIKSCDIRLDDVHFGYDDKEVLHGVSMDIKSGTVNAIVGPSGSGKSTIAKLIASLWDATGGSITIGGANVNNVSLESLNNSIAYVAQDNYLFNDTILENIRVGKKNATDEEVYEVCKKCGCYDFIMGLENGFNTIVGSAGGHLSGGEKQRISIARSMLKDAPIIILDEATAYTDPENEAIIQASLAKMIKGKTLIVIAHRLSTIIDSDNIFLVNDGVIEATGTHKTLLKSSRLYKDMWNSHISSKDEWREE